MGRMTGFVGRRGILRIQKRLGAGVIALGT